MMSLRGSSEDAVVFVHRYAVEMGDNGDPIFANTNVFKICYGSALIVLVLAQLGVAAAFLMQRRKPTLELSQPVAISIFVIAGAVATGGCYTLISGSNVMCIIRQPILFLALSIMGSTLAGRTWRITSLIAPTLQLGKDSSSRSQDSLRAAHNNGSEKRIKKSISIADRIRGAKFGAVRFLNGIPDFRWSHCARYFKQKAVPAEESHVRTKTLRRIVPFHHMLRVVFVIALPQLCLQILNLSVPTMRSQLHVSNQAFMCKASTGAWPIILGAIFTVYPFLLALLLNFPSAGVPDMFCEYGKLIQSLQSFLLVLCVAGPAIALTESPNGITYLQAGILLSLVLALSWNLAWIKIIPSRMRRLDNQTQKPWNRTGTSKFGAKRSTGRLSYSSHSDSEQDGNADAIEEADNALTLGKMYEQMGSVDKALQIYDGALSQWKSNGESYKDGYTTSEINAFGPEDLKIIIQLLYTKSKAVGTHMYQTKSGSTEAARLSMEVLKIFEACPAKMRLKDQSFILPVYSLMYSFIEGGNVSQDPAFEADIVNRFKKQACAQAFHYCRTLAVCAQSLAKKQDYEAALDEVAFMRKLYNPSLHTKLIEREYAYDHCANYIAVSAVWLYHTGMKEEAYAVTEEVIDSIIPFLDPKNVLGTTLLLLPTIVILKRQGQVERAQKIYQKYVCDNVEKYQKGKESFARSLMRPIQTLLKLCEGASYNHEDELDSDIQWILEECKTKKTTDGFSDMFCTKFCWSLKSLFAEICLHLARRVEGEMHGKIELIREGLQLSKAADRIMKDDEGNEGNVKYHIAYELHQPIMNELQSMATDSGIDMSVVD